MTDEKPTAVVNPEAQPSCAPAPCSASVVGFPITLQLHARGRDKRTWQLMSKNTRSKTFLPFALWLVETARHVGQNERADRSE